MKLGIIFKKCGRFNPISALTWLGSMKNKDAWRFNYCHTELWLPDEAFSFETNGLRLGQCFSARPDGVSFKSAEKVLTGYAWDYWEIEISQKCYERIMSFMNKEAGDKYDYSGLMHYILVFVAQDPNRWYCSEIVGTIADIIGVIDLIEYEMVTDKTEDYVKITPRDLGLEFYREFGEPVEIKK
jgi:hypothetical protein